MPCNTSARAYAEDKSDILGSPLPGREIGGGNGSEGVCIPAKKKFSQLKASRLCCDGAAGLPRDSGSPTLIAGPP